MRKQHRAVGTTAGEEVETLGWVDSRGQTVLPMGKQEAKGQSFAKAKKA